MAKLAVVKAGGKQFLVKENDEIYVERLAVEENKEVELQTLAVFNDEDSKFQLGSPVIEGAVKAQVLGHVRGDKVRIARFKAKVRYRRIKGFRPELTKIKILNI